LWLLCFLILCLCCSVDFFPCSPPSLSSTSYGQKSRFLNPIHPQKLQPGVCNCVLSTSL
jgi:hypothetical protein